MPKYEAITSVDFGTLSPNTATGEARQDDRKYQGVQEAGATLELSEKEAAPLLAAGAIKPEGVSEPFRNDNPEEHGYQGEEIRNNAMKTDEVYTKPSKSSAKNKG